MKLRNFLSMGVLSVLALGACTPNADDNSEWIDGSQPVSFTSSIHGVKTRAANNAWDTSGTDEVGVFTKKSGAFDAANKHYGVSATGALASKSAEDAIYYPTDGAKVDFVAYYPYTATLTNNTYAVNLSDQSTQSKIDLLYSKNATQKDNTVTAPVQLTFAHQLTKVVLNITRDATIPTLAGLQVGISGTNRKATFDLSSGLLTSPTDMADIAAKVKEDGSLAEAIILPVNGLNSGKISFTLNGETKTWDIPASQNYAAGSQYTYPVTIKETGGQISVTFGDASITDWTTVAGGNIDIDFGNGGGTVDPPTPPIKTNLLVNPGFEDWTAALATGWDNATYNMSVTKSTDVKRSGSNAAKHTSAASAVKIQQEVAIVAGKKYRISYWYLDNDNAACSRVWSAWLGTGTSALVDDKDKLQAAEYTVDDALWKEYSVELVAPAAATKLRFEVRTYRNMDQPTGGTSGGAVYYDDFELVEIQ